MEATRLHGFTRSEVVAIFEKLGITPPTKKQFYYWAQTGLVEVEMANLKEPLYSFQTILDLLVIQKLLQGGVSLQRIRKALSFLAEEYNWGNLETKPCLQQYQLLTDGSQIYLVTDTTNVMNIVSQPRQLGWHGVIFPAEEIVEKSAAAIISLPEWKARLRPEEVRAYSDYWPLAAE